MDHDDLPIGRILSRREVLAMFGAASASVLIGCGPTQSVANPTAVSSSVPATATTPPTASIPPATTTAPTNTLVPATALPTNTLVPATIAAAEPTAASVIAVPACIIRPEATEGPYYVDEGLVRSDVRADPATGELRDGALFVLTFNVVQVDSNGCTALKDALVDIWHCDAAGVYSDVTDRSFDTRGQQWLRGSQTTDANGVATFTTIYPGWYPGRAVHIHYKVHPTSTSVFTSQLFFDDTLSDQVFTQAPYAAYGTRNRYNNNDGIYRSEMLMNVSKTDQGYAATFEVGVQL